MHGLTLCPQEGYDKVEANLYIEVQHLCRCLCIANILKRTDQLLLGWTFVFATYLLVPFVDFVNIPATTFFTGLSLRLSYSGVGYYMS